MNLAIFSSWYIVFLGVSFAQLALALSARSIRGSGLRVSEMLLIAIGVSFSSGIYFLYSPGDLAGDNLLLVANSIFFSAAALPLGFCLFCIFFTGRVEELKSPWFITLSMTALILLASALDNRFVLAVSKDPVVDPIYGSMSLRILLLVYVVFSAYFVFYKILIRSARSETDPGVRFQYRAVLVSGLVCSSLLFVTNGLIPLLFKTSANSVFALVWFGLFFSALLFIQIEGQKVFVGWKFFQLGYVGVSNDIQNYGPLLKLRNDIYSSIYQRYESSGEYTILDSNGRGARFFFNTLSSGFVKGLEDQISRLQGINFRLSVASQKLVQRETGEFSPDDQEGMNIATNLVEKGAAQPPGVAALDIKSPAYQFRPLEVDLLVPVRSEEEPGGLSNTTESIWSGDVIVERILKQADTGGAVQTDLFLKKDAVSLEFMDGKVFVHDPQAEEEIFSGCMAEQPFLSNGFLEVHAFSSPKPGEYWKCRVRFQFS